MASRKHDPATGDPGGEQPDTGYAVGYKKPPVAHRFRKGQSGNPRGRPKGSRNKIPAMNEERLKQIVLEEAYRTIPVQDQGRQVTIPIAQAVIRSLAVNAAKGNTRAQKLFTELLSHTETSRMREHAALMEAAIEFKSRWQREFDRCDRLGHPRPEPLPHPDHVIIDFRANTVRFTGPMTREEKRDYDLLARKKRELLHERDLLRTDLATTDCAEERHLYEQDVVHVEEMLDIIRTLIPD